MPDASHDFGARLRQAREQRGIALHDIAERTKISVLALEALERNDVSRLPGGIFTRAFVRAYATEVGLDPDDSLRQFLAQFPDEAQEETPRAVERRSNHIVIDEAPTSGRAWRAVVWSLPLLAGAAYFAAGGRLPFWPGRPAVPATPVETQAQGAAPIAAPPPPQSFEAPPAADQPPAAATETLPGTSGAGAAVQPGPSAIAVPAVSQEVLATAVQPPAATEPPAGGFRVTLAPREECWVSVSANGTRVFSGLMRPGDRQQLTLEGRVTLTVGNAGGFGFLINDRPARSLGGPGQPVTVKLQADTLDTFLEAR